MAGPGKPGRPSKGPRKERLLAYPIALDPLVRKRARERGCPDVNSYIVQVLAADLGWEPDDPTQAKLPMAEAS
jgi:hypothetical protein